MKNFDSIKSQLRELAEIVNSFKSEAVQLRIVELVFGVPADSEPDSVPTAKDEALTQGKKKSKTKRRGSPKANSATPADRASKPARASGQGGPATLTRLFEEGFFKKAQTIRAIVDHCETNLARKFKQSDFSGALARLVRNGSLRRVKNEENQYEYRQA